MVPFLVPGIVFYGLGALPRVVGDHFPGDVVQIRETVEAMGAKRRVDVVDVELAVAGPIKT
jgi:hypothetical protein